MPRKSEAQPQSPSSTPSLDKEWLFLGSGSFNHAFKKKNEVFKLQKNPKDLTDSPERSVRLWNQINPTIPAREETIAGKKGWICPFIEGKKSTDKEISNKLIDIYNNTGRIVIDASVRGNFKTTPDKKVICLDIGLALQLEHKEDKRAEQITVPNSLLGSRALQRKNSVISTEEWDARKEKSLGWFNNPHQNKPKTIKIVKCLLMLKKLRPDLLEVNFLKTDPKLVKALVDANDNPYQEYYSAQALEKLSKHKPLTLESVKKSCEEQLLRYINSRGSLDETRKNFTPSLGTFLLRDSSITINKIGVIIKLLEKIETCQNLNALKDVIKSTSREAYQSGSMQLSGLGSSILKCLEIVNKSYHSPYFENGLERDNPQPIPPPPKITRRK